MIVDLWRYEAGKYFCISTKSRAGVWHDEFFTRNELGEVADYVREHRDKDLYFCPHGLTKPRRKKEYAVLPSLLWADMDEADPRKVKWRPTVAIQSSPGRYVGLWECDDVVTEKLNKRLTYAIGADRSGHDLTQVLRLPGTINYKYAALPRVQLLWDDGPTYRVRDLSRTLTELDERERKAETAERVAVSGWRKLTGKELATRHFGVEPNKFAHHWHRRFVVIHGVWGPMTERGASLEQVLHALDDCRAWHSKIEEHGEAWRRREIRKIEEAIDEAKK